MYTQFDEKDPACLDLQSGAPHRTLQPVDLYRTSSQIALDQSLWPRTSNGLALTDHVLQYGPEVGDPDVRRAIASLLSSKYSSQEGLVPERMLLHGGASQGLMMVLHWLRHGTGSSVHARPMPHVYLPPCTYFLGLKILREAGMTDDDVTVVRDDAEGLDVDDLERHLVRAAPPASDAPRALQLLYLIPTYANPTGTVMPHERRKRLVELARTHNLLIVTDDVYELLGYDGDEALPRLAAYDIKYGSGRHVIANVSFSKVLGPGLRFGYLEAHPSLIHELAQTAWLESGGCASHFTSRLLLPVFCADKSQHFPQLQGAPITAFEHIVGRARAELGARRDALIHALKTHLFPLGFSFPYGVPRGGYFVLLGLPAGLSSDAFRAACQKAQVLVAYSGGFSPTPAKLMEQLGTDCVRLSFAFYEPAQLAPQLRALAAALRELP